MRTLTALTSRVVAASRTFPQLLVACVILTTAGSVTAQQQLTLGFNGAPNGPLPWSEQGFTFTDGSGPYGSEDLTGGRLRISAFGSGFGFGSVVVKRTDGQRFDARSLDIISVNGDIFDITIGTDAGADWYPTGVGTEVFTGPEFEDIQTLVIYAFPPSDTSVVCVMDNLVVEVEDEPWADLGDALAGTLGDPFLVGTGTLSDGSANALDLVYAAPSTAAALFLAPGSTPVPFKGGTLVPFPFLDPMILNTSASGAISIPFVMPQGLPAGTEIWAQWAIQDAAAIHGVALSNAIKGTTP